MIFGSSLIVSIIPFFSRIIHHLANIETKMSPFFILKGEKDALITNIDGKVPSSKHNHKLGTVRKLLKKLAQRDTLFFLVFIVVQA